MQNKKEGVKLARRPKKDQPAPPVAPAPAPAPAASATAVPATSRDSVYREAKAADEELRKLVADGKVQLDRSVTQSRNRLRQHLESLLFIDYAFAQQKDIELQLWKNCFYKVIEEYRARIRKLSRAAAKDASAGTPPASAPAAPAAATASSAAAKHKEELDALCAQFRAFLAQSHRFYFNLISRLCAAHGLKTDGSVDLHPLLADASGAPSVPRAYVSVHRSLIYLGDLARYHRDLVGEDTRKDWAQAARYYDQAILLFPWIGNPYNQLAVLAAYDADHLAVFYFYARALSCESPFVTARENAAAAIERNRVRLAGGGSGGGSGAKRAEGEEELFATDAPTDGLSEAERETVSLYGSHLVRIFGMLFTRTALEALPDAETAALRYLDALLSAGLATEQLLVRSVLCLIFVLWHLSPPLPTGTGPSAPFAEVAQRANLLRLATRFTLRFVSVLCRAYRPQWHPTALPALALLADWLALRPELLHPTTGEDTAPWQQLWPALVNLSNVLNVEPITAPVPPQARDALPEEWEARGFIPLALAVAPLTFSGPKRHAKIDAAHALRLRSHKWSVVLGQLLASPPDARRAFFYSTHHTPHYSTSPQLPSHAAASPVVSHASAHSSVAVNGVPSAVQSVSVARASAYTPIQPPSPVLAPLPTPEAKPHSQETPAFKPAPAPVPTDSDLLEDEVILFAPQAETDVANLLASSVDEGPNSTSDPSSAIPLPQMEAPPEDDDDDLIMRSPHTSASGNFPSASWTPFGGSGSFFTPMAEQRGPAPPGFSAFQQPHASAWPSQPSGGSFFGDLPDGEELEALEPVAPSGPPGFDPKPSAAIYRNRGTGRASVIQPIRQPRGPDSGVRGFAKRGGSVA